MDENNKIDYQTLTRTLDLLPMAAYAVEADSRKIIFLNKKAVQEFGEIDEEPCYKHIYGLELPCPFCTFEGGKNKTCNTTEEYEAYNFKNHRRYKISQSSILTDEYGEIKLQIASEILQSNDSKEGERYLFDIFRSIADNASDMIWAKDMDSKYIFANKAICDNLLIAENTDEPIGKTDTFFAKREREKHRDNPNWHTFGEMCHNSDIPVLQSKLPIRIDEYGNVRGKFLFLEVHKAPLYDKEGNLIGTVGTARDVTKQKELEAELKKTIEFQKTIFENNAAGIMIVDSKRDIVAVNKQLVTIFGYDDKSEIIGKNARFLHATDESYQKWAPKFETVKDGMLLANVEYTGRQKNGTVIWCLFYGTKISLENGENGVMWSLVDVTKERKAREELKCLNEMLERKIEIESAKMIEHERLMMQQSRMSAMGEMIGAIAHQWRQPLNALGLMIQDADMSYRCNEMDTEYFASFKQKSMEQISFMSKTIDDFRDFFKIDKEIKSFPVISKINEVISLLKPQFASSDIQITLEQNCDCSVSGYPNEFMQVILNILNNAKDAIIQTKKEGGLIKITTRCRTNACVTTIEDNGGGIEKQVIEKIFDPYFTTKAPDKGTGIGLYMAKTIIEKHMEGTINVTNTENGALFSIMLPRTK